MKKFLIPLILGVVLMAIGTTSLIFELNEFEHVNTYGMKEYDGRYRNETIPLKEEKDLILEFDEDEMDYGYSIDWKYDDTLQDSVILTFANGVAYQISGNKVRIDADHFYIDEEEFPSDWERFKFILEGLKEKKIYTMNQAPIVITTTHENRNRIQIVNE